LRARTHSAFGVLHIRSGSATLLLQSKGMSSSSVARASGVLIRWLICGLLVILPLAGVRGAQDERSPQDLLKEAESLQQAGKLDQAIEDYRLILKRYPDVAAVRSNLGAALAGAGRYQEAIVEYERALQLQPLPQIRLNLALAYYKADKLDAAVAALKQVQVEMPNDLRPAMLLADCYLRLGQNKEVIELLDPLQPTRGDDLGLIYMLGTALVRDGQVARGQAIIDKILKNGDSAEARLLMGTTKLAVHEPQDALEDLQKAIELDPTLVSAHSIYGRALMQSANPDEAQKAFRAELNINPNDFDSNLYLGVLLKGEQRYDEALPYLKHALEVRPGDAGARYQIAALHLAENDFEEAQRELEALVKVSPDFLEAHVSLATLYYRLKRKEDGDRERAIVAKLTAEKQARESADAKQSRN
jgi:tetratricopeptide (TPR) repeat protein